MSSLLVHDRRLAGRSPDNFADYVYEVDDSVPIDQLMGWIHDYAASQGGLQNLYIMCHGYMNYWDLADQQSLPIQAGGFGLELCTEGLNLGNANVMAALKDDITTITLFSCGAADTGIGNYNTVGDGRRFCGEMAMQTHATVIAAMDTQIYSNDRTFWDWIHGRQGEIDFGTWEGFVLSFSPVDGSATYIKAPPQNQMDGL